MAELKQFHEARAGNLAEGHGQYREVAQDEFLPEVTGSQRVVAHFYHNDFQRCKVCNFSLMPLLCCCMQLPLHVVLGRVATHFHHSGNTLHSTS